jgi:FimV-like protein
MKNTIIHQYLNDTLSETENERVERALLRTMFEQEQKKQWLAEVARNKKNTILGIRYRSLMAVAATLILGIGTWFLYQGQAVSLQQESSHYLAERFDSPETKMGSDTDATYWATAKEAYRNEKYETCVANIAQLSQLEQEHYFYMGLALLYQPQPNIRDATQAFLKARTFSTSSYQKEITWFLANAYIQQNDLTNAKKELQQFIQAGSTWKIDEAKKLLEKMP